MRAPMRYHAARMRRQQGGPMAKKPSAKARKANEEAVRQSKLDEKYGKPLFSLTYDMNE